MNDKCREEFEKWYRQRWGDSPVRDGDSYAHAVTNWVWESWQVAWKQLSHPVSRDGWLTADEIALWGAPNDEGEAMRRMAFATLRLYAERAALFTQLKAAIETIERGNV